MSYIVTVQTRIPGETAPSAAQIRQALQDSATEATVEKYGITLEVEQERYVDEALNPRNACNLGTMVCFHKRYSLGDETDLKSDMFEGWDEMENHLRTEEEAVILLPVSLHDHSGISMRVGVSSGWDSGRVGYIYTTEKRILGAYEETSLSPELLAAAEKCLRSEVEMYDHYIRGEVYGYTVRDSLGEVLDSCTGFFFEEDAQLEGDSSLSFYRKREAELDTL